MSYVIIGIHGPANKPAKKQHAQDWVYAIYERIDSRHPLKMSFR